MSFERYLVVNADDFGLSEGVNRGIVRAHEHGIVTSTSLMVRWPAAAAAPACARRHPQLGFGLHIDLAEWVYRNDEWVLKYEVVPASDAAAIAAEVQRQFDMFRRLMGKDPTHLDSHQHAHLNEPARQVISRLAASLSVPLRSITPGVHYCGDFYGQTGEGYPYPEGISLEALLKTIRNLPEGTTEMGCHPGDDQQLDSVYRLERSQEVTVLCHPETRSALTARGVVLCSFAGWPGRPQPAPVP
jgi:predicted glycoside hydrolase/deacetylase ChbG (UPF0249 family)